LKRFILQACGFGGRVSDAYRNERAGFGGSASTDAEVILRWNLLISHENFSFCARVIATPTNGTELPVQGTSCRKYQPERREGSIEKNGEQEDHRQQAEYREIDRDAAVVIMIGR
jgi:hypothetical protein